MTGRLLFVDAARTLAVVLAFVAHGMTTVGGWDALHRLPVAALRMATYTATPLFVLLFGAMLEMVYVPRLAREGGVAVRARLRRRGLVCYLGYVATVASSVAGGHLTAAEGAAAAAFLGDSHFSNILKYYALAMLVATPLLRLRRRLGLAGLAAAAAGLWGLSPLLGALPWPARGEPLAYLTVLLVGRPAGSASVSLLHSQVLVVAGMVLGRSLATSVARDAPVPFRRATWALTAGGLAVVLALAAALGPRAVAVGWLTRAFRGANHVGYYAMGAVSVGVALLALARLVSPIAREGEGRRVAVTLGRSSALAFPLGNCLLNLWPRGVVVPATAALLLTAAFPALVTRLVLLVERLRPLPVSLPPAKERAR